MIKNERHYLREALVEKLLLKGFTNVSVETRLDLNGKTIVEIQKGGYSYPLILDIIENVRVSDVIRTLNVMLKRQSAEIETERVKRSNEIFEQFYKED